MKFETLAMEWLENKQNYLKESTISYYMFELQNYIFPEIGGIEIELLTEEIIQQIVSKWQSQYNNHGRLLKKSTISNLVMLIKQILKYGIKKNVILSFELDILYLPEICENKNKIFSDENQNKIIESVLSDLSYKSFGILLSLSTGIRIGELCALHWYNIDIVQEILTVNSTLQRIYNKSSYPRTKIIIDEPKTMKSKRIIPLSKTLQNIVQQIPEINNEGYVLTNSNTPMEPRTYRRFYKEFLVKNNIDYINFHSLRHSFATRLIQNGADYKCVSELLGHTNINTTLNMYVHPNLKEKRKCIELF